MTPAAGDGAFRARTVALLLAIGVIGFVGMLVLGAYGPDLRSGRNGGAHALSTGATGYAGIVRLAAETGRGGRVLRNDRLLDTEDLVVVTPENGAIDMTRVLAQRAIKPTLVVLPKWATVADPDHDGWVRHQGLVPRMSPEGVLAPANRFRIARRRGEGHPLVTINPLMAGVRFTAPRPVQIITRAQGNAVNTDAKTRWVGRIKPLVTDGRGGIVVAQVDDRPFYILADPDLLSNLGMRDARQARSALAMLDWMNSTGATTINFDVTLNGFGTSLSPLKLAFDPPFLAMTLTLAAALLLAAWQATATFGSPRGRTRALAFGKATLVDNSAMLVRKAGREAALGARYADVIRARAAAAFGAPARLKGAALDAYLDALRGRARFTDLARAAGDATDRHALLDAARALNDWKDKP